MTGRPGTPKGNPAHYRGETYSPSPEQRRQVLRYLATGCDRERTAALAHVPYDTVLRVAAAAGWPNRTAMLEVYVAEAAEVRAAALVAVRGAEVMGTGLSVDDVLTRAERSGSERWRRLAVIARHALTELAASTPAVSDPPPKRRMPPARVIRAWAVEQGMAVRPGGQLARAVTEAYLEAHPNVVRQDETRS